MSKQKVEGAPAMRQVLATRTNGDRLRLTFPAAWKMTLSKGLNPADAGNPHYGGPRGAGAVLRLYETAGQQRTVLMDVYEVYDLTDMTAEKQVCTVMQLPPGVAGQRGVVENREARIFVDRWEPLLEGTEERERPAPAAAVPLDRFYAGGLGDLMAQQALAPGEVNF
jgi:hypothetical protein